MFLIEQLLTLIYFDPVMMWKKIYDITRITLTQTPTRVFPSLLPVNPSIVHLQQYNEPHEELGHKFQWNARRFMDYGVVRGHVRNT